MGTLYSASKTQKCACEGGRSSFLKHLVAATGKLVASHSRMNVRGRLVAVYGILLGYMGCGHPVGSQV